MKNTLKAIFTFAVASVIAVSCTKNFENINRDINNPSSEQMAQDGLAVGGMFQALQRSVFAYDESRDSDYQIAYNLCADTWSGYSTPIEAFGAGHFHDAWDFYDQWCRSLWNFKNMQTLGSFNKFEAQAQELNMSNELALATIIKVASMHQMTDYYGPIAYTTSGNLKNNYDPQDVVYEQFFKELDASIETLEAICGTGAKIMAAYDQVYNGDVQQWVKFANSLRLRLAMRIRYADPELARTEAEKSINSPVGVIESNADNAVFADNGKPHFLVNIITFNKGGDAALGASLECYLNGYDDPRKFKYGLPAGDGKLHGVRPGIKVSNYTDYKHVANKVSTFNADAFKITWQNAAEVAFLRAEGALAGWNMGGTAKDFYEEGIKLSFEEWGADGAAAYITNKTAKPAEYKAAVGKMTVAAPSDITIAWNEQNSAERNLERIAVQKWLAIFPNGAEAWAEQRRLHYPVLIEPARNLSNDTVKSSQGARRVPYPESESITNPEGYASGLEALGGADNAGTRLWWDQKPFNK